MKKILISLPSFGGGGAERVMVNLANNLDPEKFDVHFLVLSNHGPYKKLLSNHINVINLNTKRVRNSRKKIIGTVNKIKPDIIFSTHEHMNLLMLSIKNKINKNTKIYIRLTNTISQTLKEMSRIERLIWYHLINYYYHKADRIIAQCYEMKQDFLQIFNIKADQISHIYNPLDLNMITNSITSTNPFKTNYINFLAVGRLVNQKGFDILIEAFAQVIKILPNSYLTILGEGEEKENLIKLTDDLNLSNYISFKGFVDNTFDYYFYSDVYILSSRYEGFPNTLLEALACGTKVVSTACKSGPTEILKNKYGVISKVEDDKSLAKSMIIAYKRSNMSGNRADHFDINKIVREYEYLFLNE